MHKSDFVCTDSISAKPLGEEAKLTLLLELLESGHNQTSLNPERRLEEENQLTQPKDARALSWCIAYTHLALVCNNNLVQLQ